jgi:hypothetical protein
MAAHSRLKVVRHGLTPDQNPRLEQELGPAVLDAGLALWREYSHLCESAPESFPECSRDLLTWYAELQYKTRGGGKCSLCGAVVRHALKVRAERTDNSTRTYLCLCTRCLVAEETLSHRVLHQVAGHWVEGRTGQKAAAPPLRRPQAA